MTAFIESVSKADDQKCHSKWAPVFWCSRSRSGPDLRPWSRSQTLDGFL